MIFFSMKYTRFYKLKLNPRVMICSQIGFREFNLYQLNKLCDNQDIRAFQGFFIFQSLIRKSMLWRILFHQALVDVYFF